MSIVHPFLDTGKMCMSSTVADFPAVMILDFLLPLTSMMFLLSLLLLSSLMLMVSLL
jgi:hypothetical protein